MTRRPAVARELPDLPLIINNVPSRTAVDIAPETVLHPRREFDNVVGVKETTREFGQFSNVLHLCGSDTLFWSGVELRCMPLLALGASGFANAPAEAPGATARRYNYWSAGDHKGALDLRHGLRPLVSLTDVETELAPVQWVLEQAGLLRSGQDRPPFVPPVRARASA